MRGELFGTIGYQVGPRNCVNARADLDFRLVLPYLDADSETAFGENNLEGWQSLVERA